MTGRKMSKPDSGSFMSEFELIARLTRDLATNERVVVGAGDDCAVLDFGLPHVHFLFKTDSLVEGVHCLASDAPERIGHKVIARNLSDVAAMGGSPETALVTLGLPDAWTEEAVEGIYRGLNATAKRFGVAVVGGEITASRERLWISVALIGTVASGKAVLRSGARPGDAIFVTGALGGSSAGRHLDFEPRVREGKWLADRFSIGAMIDLSDGLAGDLRHVLSASGVGGEVAASMIPISPDARRKSGPGSGSKTPLSAALSDGEDFELLFTVRPSDAVKLKDDWKREFPDLKLSCIGKITAAPGLFIRDRNGVRSLAENGYSHLS